MTGQKDARLHALKDIRVLIVDDQRYFRGVVAQSLRPLVATVNEASDGQAALVFLGLAEDADSLVGRLRQQRPDLFRAGLYNPTNVDCILTDIRMAPMNGLEMLKAIRVGYTTAPRDLPVIIMSAHSDEAMIGAAIGLDVHGFVSKPVSQQTVVDRIHRAMQVKLVPKSVDAYRKLIIPRLDETSMTVDARQPLDYMKPPIRAQDVSAANDERTLNVGLAGLSQGDIATADFRTMSGHMVVPAGTHISQILIDAIHDLAQVTSLPSEILITRMMS